MTPTSHSVTTGRTRGPDSAVVLPWRAATALTALAVALLLGFLFGPGPLAAVMSTESDGERRDLADRFSASFLAYWHSGRRGFPPELQRAVDYWFHFHVVKAVAAALLLITLGALGLLLWKTFLRAGGLARRGRVALASAGTLVTALALVSLAAVMANVQGAIAPFSSLLPMLPTTAPHGEFADTFADIRRQLADRPDAGAQNTPPLQFMLDDFSRYHAVIAVAAAIVAATLVGASAVAWRRFAKTTKHAGSVESIGSVGGVGPVETLMSARSAATARPATPWGSDRRARRVFRSLGLVAGGLALAFAVVTVANVGTTADPAPGLLAFFEGTW